MRRWMKQIKVWLVAAACGFAAALVICRWSGTAFGLFMWSVIAAGAGFVVAGVGFFSTEEQAYLYDFYGELLNEHQRRIYEDFVFNDLSLGEIADEEGISRQGVHDMVKRCTKTLEGYEEKLHLIAKFMSAKRSVEQIHALTKQFHESHDEAVIVEIEQISNQILEEL